MLSIRKRRIRRLHMVEIKSMMEQTKAEGTTLEVYDPTGAIEINQLYAPRLADLSGKTIGELSNGSWGQDRIFPLIRKLLQKRFPDTKIIPYTEFPVGSFRIDVENIAEIMKAKGCQAAIIGNAG